MAEQQQLAPIFVNNERIRVQGDPQPKVSKIIETCGKQVTQVEVLRLTSREDMYGSRLAPEETIDRTAESNPVFLKLLDKQSEKAGAESVGTGVPSPNPRGGGGGKPTTPAPPKGQPPSGGGPTPSPTPRPSGQVIEPPANAPAKGGERPMGPTNPERKPEKKGEAIPPKEGSATKQEESSAD